VIWSETGDAVEREELLAHGLILLLFYLHDWSRT